MNSYWRDEANCKSLNKDLFFPQKKMRVTSQAVEACKACPVVKECAEWSIKHEIHGYWGGMTAHERAQIRARNNIFPDIPESRIFGAGLKVRRQRRPLCGTPGGYKSHRLYGEPMYTIENGGCGCIEAHSERMRQYQKTYQDRRAQSK
jgi:WhiB family redox-sensing transcriptional regulator